MQYLGTPKNAWGWLRIAGTAGLAAVLLWTLLAAVLRALGGVAWMAWSGYPTFTVLRGFELAVFPLLVAVIAGWLESHDHQVETEQHQQREKARAAENQRRVQVKQLHASILHALAGSSRAPAESGQRPDRRVREIVLAALAELDGAGRGEALHFLYEHGLLSAENPPLDLSGADFSGLTLHKPHFRHIQLDGANLGGAKLDAARFEDCRLTGVNFGKAFLRRAELKGSLLTGCDLSGARLEHANLEGCDLAGACLDGAYLMHASLKDCKIEHIKCKQDGGLGILEQAVLLDTIFPDGKKVTNEKGKAYLRSKEIAVLVDRL